MYVRALNHFDDWSVEDLDQLPTIAISDWATKSDSDFSVYKIYSMNDLSALDNIAIRFFLSNTKNIRFALLPLYDSFLANFEVIDDKLLMDCIHANIKNTIYPDFRKCVEYSFHNIDKCKTYNLKLLKSLFLKMSSERLDSLIKASVDFNINKIRDKKRAVKNILFRDCGDNLPECLK